MPCKSPLAAALLLVALCLIPVAPTQAQSGGWSAPFELSDITRARWSWFPDIAVGPDGRVSVIWCSFPKSTDYNGDPIAIDALMYRELKGTEWSPLNDIFSLSYSISGSNEYTVRNSIVAGRDGKLHVVFRAKTDVAYFQAPYDLAWSAREWSPFKLIAPEGGYYNALAVDNSGTIHAFWTQTVIDPPDKPRPGCPNCANLFYRRSTDGGATWSLSMNLSQEFEGANRPQVKVDQYNRIHVVWDEGFDWYVGNGKPKYSVYKRSDDGGQTWTDGVVFNHGDVATFQTTLALTADANPIVVYRTDQWLYLQTSDDGGKNWSRPREIPGIRARHETNLDSYSMAVDGGGHLHLIAGGYRVNSPSDVPALLHLSWDGANWSEPAVIVQNGLYHDWPRIAIANGNKLHVVWYSHEGPLRESALKQVWYSTKTVDAPQVAPAPLFTPTPRPEPTALPTVTPAPTALPEAVAMAQVVDGPPAWERPAMAVIGVALLPVTTLLLVVVAVARRMR